MQSNFRPMQSTYFNPPSLSWDTQMSSISLNKNAYMHLHMTSQENANMQRECNHSIHLWIAMVITVNWIQSIRKLCGRVVCIVHCILWTICFNESDHFVCNSRFFRGKSRNRIQNSKANWANSKERWQQSGGLKVAIWQ